MKAYVGAMVLITATGLSRIGSAQDAPLPAAAVAITARDIAGAGGWKTDGTAAHPLKRWNLDVHRGDDNSITGRVNLGGSPLASSGNVNGHIVGTLVTGTITDDDGKQVAKFHGQLNSQGMSGTYTDRTGETGSWSWDGQLPQ